jgi:hypothetical protein
METKKTGQKSFAVRTNIAGQMEDADRKQSMQLLESVTAGQFGTDQTGSAYHLQTVYGGQEPCDMNENAQDKRVRTGIGQA